MLLILGRSFQWYQRILPNLSMSKVEKKLWKGLSEGGNISSIVVSEKENLRLCYLLLVVTLSSVSMLFYTYVCISGHQFLCYTRFAKPWLHLRWFICLVYVFKNQWCRSSFMLSIVVSAYSFAHDIDCTHWFLDSGRTLLFNKRLPYFFGRVTNSFRPNFSWRDVNEWFL